MSQINCKYYPENTTFTEISIRFMGERRKPVDVMCYFKLKSLSKKLDMIYPEFIIDNDFFSYGNFLYYQCRSILDDNDEKRNKVKVICNELIKYGIKNKSIPMIKITNYGEKTTRFELNDYLKSKGINLEDLNIEKMILDEESLDESR